MSSDLDTALGSCSTQGGSYFVVRMVQHSIFPVSKSRLRSSRIANGSWLYTSSRFLSSLADDRLYRLSDNIADYPLAPSNHEHTRGRIISLKVDEDSAGLDEPQRSASPTYGDANYDRPVYGLFIPGLENCVQEGQLEMPTERID